MKIDETLSSIRSATEKVRKSPAGKTVQGVAAIAASIWVLLKLRRELYGPGGTKLTRYVGKDEPNR